MPLGGVLTDGEELGASVSKGVQHSHPGASTWGEIPPLNSLMGITIAPPSLAPKHLLSQAVS